MEKRKEWKWKVDLFKRKSLLEETVVKVIFCT